MENEKFDYERFAKYTIERWQERMDKVGIRGTGELRRSFVSHVRRDANGDVNLMAFAFHFYGWYVDAGVGRGYRHGNGGDLPFLKDWKTSDKHRRPKPWFNKVYWNEFNKLVVMVAQTMGESAAEKIRQFELQDLKFD